MKLSEHLFESSTDGGLYDTRVPQWHKQPPLRARYSWHHGKIKTVSEFKATLRAGAYAWPGGYPLYFVTSDGAALSFKTARKEFRSIAASIRDKSSDGWRVMACDVNYEDGELIDDHTGERIESAYAD